MTPNLVPLILKYWHKKDDDNHSDLDDKDKDDKGDYFLISRKKNTSHHLSILRMVGHRTNRDR